MLQTREAVIGFLMASENVEGAIGEFSTYTAEDLRRCSALSAAVQCGNLAVVNLVIERLGDKFKEEFTDRKNNPFIEAVEKSCGERGTEKMELDCKVVMAIANKLAQVAPSYLCDMTHLKAVEEKEFLCNKIYSLPVLVPILRLLSDKSSFVTFVQESAVGIVEDETKYQNDYSLLHIVVMHAQPEDIGFIFEISGLSIEKILDALERKISGTFLHQNEAVLNFAARTNPEALLYILKWLNKIKNTHSELATRYKNIIESPMILLNLVKNQRCSDECFMGIIRELGDDINFVCNLIFLLMDIAQMRPQLVRHIMPYVLKHTTERELVSAVTSTSFRLDSDSDHKSLLVSAIDPTWTQMKGTEILKALTRRNYYGMTPAHFAAISNPDFLKSIISFLLDKAITPEEGAQFFQALLATPNILGETPWHLVARHNPQNITDFFGYGVDNNLLLAGISSANIFGDTPLQMLVGNEQFLRDIITNLIRAFVDNPQVAQVAKVIELFCEIICNFNDERKILEFAELLLQNSIIGIRQIVLTEFKNKNINLLSLAVRNNNLSVLKFLAEKELSELAIMFAAGGGIVLCEVAQNNPLLLLDMLNGSNLLRTMSPENLAALYQTVCNMHDRLIQDHRQQSGRFILGFVFVLREKLGVDEVLKLQEILTQRRLPNLLGLALLNHNEQIMEQMLNLLEQSGMEIVLKLATTSADSKIEHIPYVLAAEDMRVFRMMNGWFDRKNINILEIFNKQNHSGFVELCRKIFDIGNYDNADNPATLYVLQNLQVVHEKLGLLGSDVVADVLKAKGINLLCLIMKNKMDDIDITRVLEKFTPVTAMQLINPYPPQAGRLYPLIMMAEQRFQDLIAVIDFFQQKHQVQLLAPLCQDLQVLLQPLCAVIADLAHRQAANPQLIMQFVIQVHQQCGIEGVKIMRQEFEQRNINVLYFVSKYNRSETVIDMLHIAVQIGNREEVFSLLQNLREHYPDQAKMVITSRKTEDSLSVFETAIQSANPEVLWGLVVWCYQQNLHNSISLGNIMTLQKALFEKNNGAGLLHFIANYDGDVIPFMRWINDSFAWVDRSAVQMLMAPEREQGFTPLHRLVINRNYEGLIEMLKILKSRVDEATFATIISREATCKQDKNYRGNAFKILIRIIFDGPGMTDDDKGRILGQVIEIGGNKVVELMSHDSRAKRLLKLGMISALKTCCDKLIESEPLQMQPYQKEFCCSHLEEFVQALSMSMLGKGQYITETAKIDLLEGIKWSVNDKSSSWGSLFEEPGDSGSIERHGFFARRTAPTIKFCRLIDKEITALRPKSKSDEDRDHSGAGPAPKPGLGGDDDSGL